MCIILDHYILIIYKPLDGRVILMLSQTVIIYISMTLIRPTYGTRYGTLYGLDFISH
jgi:hypothetical protein